MYNKYVCYIICKLYIYIYISHTHTPRLVMPVSTMPALNQLSEDMGQCITVKQKHSLPCIAAATHRKERESSAVFTQSGSG